MGESENGGGKLKWTYSDAFLSLQGGGTHNNVTQIIPSFYTQCLVLHTVTNFVYFLFFHEPSELSHSVCIFTLNV